MMRAARLYGHKDIRIEEVPVPRCTDGHVKVAPRFNGICGSDLHFFFDAGMAAAVLSKAHPLTGEKLPLTWGHEMAGVVTEVGAGVTRVAVGDRVTVIPLINDGVCGACVRGAVNCCVQMGFRGVHGSGGGLSEAIVVPEGAAFKLPDEIDVDVGALIEPLAVGWHGVRVAGPMSASTTVLVLGSGPIGCAVILALRAKGVQNIIVSEISTVRSRFAKEFGASHVVDPSSGDVLDVVKQATDGEGVDYAFDCAGLPVTLTTGCKALKPLGTFVNMALWGQPAPLDAMEIMAKEATYKGSLSYTPRDFDEVIAALADGRIKPERMITKKIALKDVVAEGFEALHGGGGEHCKILFDLDL